MRIGLIGTGRIGSFHAGVLTRHPRVDALVVTVTPGSGGGLPATELDRMLRQCGFARDGEWAPAPDGTRWTVPCHQRDPGAAPPPPRHR